MSSQSSVPSEFRAYVARRDGDSVTRGLSTLDASDLPEGDVTIEVAWSSINYKDALATIAEGKVARIDPIVPGIDLAGVIVESGQSHLTAGQSVLAHGYDIGVARHGGFAEYARVPAEWVVPVPEGLSLRDAMAIGTAGFTAALAIDRIEDLGVRPDAGPVLVTGATGGVGRTSVDILAGRGYEVWAATGKADMHGELEELGATGFLDRKEVTAAGKPLDRQRWAAAIDAIGGPAFPYILRTLAYGGVAAACGNASGIKFETTVFPFILRSVSLVGIDSVAFPIDDRRRIWGRLATDLRPRHLELGLREVSLDELEGPLDTILGGGARGRHVVRVGAAQ